MRKKKTLILNVEYYNDFSYAAVKSKKNLKENVELDKDDLQLLLLFSIAVI